MPVVEPAPPQSVTDLHRYAEHRALGHTPRSAALASGLSESVADKACQKLEPKAKRLISDYLEKAGATPLKAAEIIAQGLDATKVSDGSEVVDYKERREYTKLYAELTGQLDRKSSGGGVSINISGKFAEMLHATIEGE